MRRMVLMAVVAAVLGGAPAVRAEDAVGDYISGAGWKFFRGVTNVTTGLPAEILTHAGGGISGPHATTIGSTLTGFFSGIVTGTAYGVARVGSGVVDLATFTWPFNENRPLVEPEFKL